MRPCARQRSRHAAPASPVARFSRPHPRRPAACVTPVAGARGKECDRARGNGRATPLLHRLFARAPRHHARWNPLRRVLRRSGTFARLHRREVALAVAPVGARFGFASSARPPRRNSRVASSGIRRFQRPAPGLPARRGRCARQRAPSASPPDARLPRRNSPAASSGIRRFQQPAPRLACATACSLGRAAKRRSAPALQAPLTGARISCRERSKLSRQRHQRGVRRTASVGRAAPRRRRELHRRCTLPPRRAARARLRLARCRSAQLRQRHRPRPLPPKLRSAARRFRPPAAEPMCGRSCGRPPPAAHGPQLRPHIGSAAPRRRRRGSPPPPPAPQLARSRGFKITRFCPHVSPTAR